MKIAAVFSFLSTLTILAGVPYAARLRGLGGPGLIDFGDAAILTQLAMAGSAPVLIDTFAFLGPLLALPIGAGWYLLLRNQKPLAGLGVLLWYLGMIFVITQDAMQLALVTKLPSAYLAADASIKPALLVFGESLAYIIDILVFAAVLHAAGLFLVSMAMAREPRVPKWIAYLGMGASLIGVASTFGSALVPGVPALKAGGPLAIITIVVVWIPAVGVVMWRRRREADTAAA